jgi:hypothetical protein
MSDAWLETEVRAIVEDYFDMLVKELTGTAYKKSEHRSVLLGQIDRSAGSIEYKHQNISAVLLDLGMPHIPGYKPAKNYQKKILPDVVMDHLITHPMIQNQMQADVDADAVIPSVDDILSSLVAAPEPAQPRNPAPKAPVRPPRRVDYLAREAANTKLGAAGETFVLNYEKARLLHAGKDNLSDRIEHVSAPEGDGAGFDIRSFEVDGGDRFIEAKTTRYGVDTPFYLTANELRFSRDHRDRYQLYRIFEFRRSPKLFTLPGFIGDQVCLEPSTFVARV